MRVLLALAVLAVVVYSRRHHGRDYDHDHKHHHDGGEGYDHDHDRHHKYDKDYKKDCKKYRAEMIRKEVLEYDPDIPEEQIMMYIEHDEAIISSYNMDEEVEWDEARGYSECELWGEEEEDDDNYTRARRHHGQKKKSDRRHGCTCEKPMPIDEICAHTECPVYERINVTGSCGFEAKIIQSAYWVTTDLGTEGGKIGLKSAKVAFVKLLDYITGGNNLNATINMTTPVLTRLKMAENEYDIEFALLSFYIPQYYQGNPPEPSSDDVKLEWLDGGILYSRAMGGGMPSRGEYRKQFNILWDNLEEAEIEDLGEEPIILDYLPPWYPRQRHEVAFFKEV